MALGRVNYESVTDEESLEALSEAGQHEGILIAIETAHAFFAARRFAKKHPGTTIVICSSGRGDKDMSTLTKTILAGGPAGV